MDVTAGLAMMFEGTVDSDSSEGTEQEVKSLYVPAPKEVAYYDTVEQARKANTTYQVPHLLREIYNDYDNIADRYYQLVINGLDTDEERVIGIKDLKTEKVISIVSEV